MALADFAIGAQTALQQALARRLALEQQQFQNKRLMRADARAERQQGMLEEQNAYNRRRQERLDADARTTKARADADAVAEQFGAGAFLPEGDTAVSIMQQGGRGALLTPTPELKGMGAGFTGPMDTGETPEQAAKGRPKGFLKMATAAQEKAQADAAAKARDDARLDQQAAATEQYRNRELALREREANRRAAGGDGGNEPLVPIIGPDGQPVLVPRSQAIGKRPANSREQGRAVTSGDANRIADFDTSLNDLATLTTAIPAGTTGTAAKVGASLPNWVTEWTGAGATAKSKQAVIDRVKQVIGKALEGGVLRREDEYKYEKILPTISDVDSVVASKLQGLETAIRQRRQTTLDALNDAGYDVSRFESRGGGSAGAPPAAAPAGGGFRVVGSRPAGGR